ncbi:protein-disulfide reductase DsbD [Scleromatobacter humisilvae]|uniref:Thiol:disulfide interchange protein DsbD n=1 Tax=Scleromatobacter humisilvae TaxID=2897159 RepID=A0A9X2BYL0_9BURK|nr:protein-disulfide reductase DsbD [Scleromatobacter humisilvae]MCK9685728.1 protein-disulfide reductase DsbD [Scleromatobacter humisilvae]
MHMIKLSSIRAALASFVLLLTLLPFLPAHAADDFLDPDLAFQLSVRVLDAKRLELSYKVAPGYYLYRERFKFSSPDAKLGEAQIPPGKKHYDTALEQNVETYHDGVVVILPVASASKAFTLNATHQGCADKGLCYPPQPRTVAVTLKAFGADADSAKIVADADASAPPAGVVAPVSVPAQGGMSVASGALPDPLRSVVLGSYGASAPQVDRPSTTTGPAPGASATAVAPASTQDGDSRLASALRGGRIALIVPLFFVAGVLLSLTPCVLPMVPILSSIIVGQGENVTRRRGFTLALAYALGMALLYTALGVAAGLLGEGLAAWLQKPWVLASFAALLVLLSLSMFGLYELQLPSALRDGLSSKGDRMRGGQVAGVFAMGGISALVVSPCVAAPLAAALLHISQTGDAVLGGLALFTLAMGMSVPLLLVGASAGALLPRAGAWMDQVKHVFGLLLIAVAIYTVQPVLPALVAMACWGVLLIVGGATLGAFEPVAAGAHAGVARAVKGVGLVLALLGVLQFVGIASGGRDPAQPLARLARAAAGDAVAASADAGPRFDRVASVAELDQRLQAAGRPVMLDFYADWCVSCKEMETQTFVDPAVRAKLDKALLLRADVTANNDDDRALLKRFHLFGPPGIILFDAQGHELETARVVGFQDAPRFSNSLTAAGL